MDSSFSGKGGRRERLDPCLRFRFYSHIRVDSDVFRTFKCLSKMRVMKRRDALRKLQTVESKISLLGRFPVRGILNIFVFTYWRLVHRGFIINRLTRLVSAVLLLGQAFCFTGCGGAPSVTIAGAYFPAWLLCAVIAVLVAAFIRAFMVAARLADYIPYQLAVCCSAGAIVALILWYVWMVY